MTPEEIAALFQQPDRQQALAQALRRQRAVGNLGLLTGDRVLSGFGAEQVRQAGQTEDDAVNQLRLLEQSKRTDAYGRSVDANSAAAKIRAEQEAERLRLQAERDALKAEETRRRAAALPGARAAAAKKAEEKRAAQLSRDASGLRKEFNALPDVRSFNEARTSFAKIEAAASKPSAANDLSLIFAYMKVLDPGSTVREGEFANAQNAAGVDSKVRNAWNNLLRGERLNPAQRAEFLSAARDIFAAQKSSFDQQAGRYRELATKGGIDPNDVTGNLEAPQPAAGAQPKRVRVSNGQETLEIDAADVEDARADGYEVVP